jgi:flagellar hook-length control protein FliK
MSTASSVAQFMAILGGSANPGLLRGEGANVKNGELDFQNLLGTTEQSTDIQTPFLLKDAIIQTRSQALTEKYGETSIIQLLQQQSSHEGANSIVLNLSQRGVPDAVIKDITAMFSENDLITILRDPQLSAQLDQTLNSVNSVTVDAMDSKSLVDAMQSMLIETQDNIEELTFRPTETPYDAVIDILVGQVAAASSDLRQSVQNAPSSSPLPISNMGIRVEPKQGGDMLPNLHEVSGHAIQNIKMSNGSDYQSIADRLVGLQNNVPNQSIQSGLSMDIDFAQMMGTGQNPFSNDVDMAMMFEAGFKTMTQATNALLNNPTATQSHPATQMVAMSLSKFAQKSGDAGESQKYRLQLDPPEMGRLDIEMDFIEGGRMKAVIAADKPETLAFLQRDMNSLLKAMQEAGFENMTQNDLSFNLSQDSNDNFAGHKGGSEQGGQGNDQMIDNLQVLESEMSVIIDPTTGQKSVNMLV